MDVMTGSYMFSPTLIAPAVTVSTASNYTGKYPFRILAISLSIYYIDAVTGMYVDGLCRFGLGSNDSNVPASGLGTMAGGIQYDTIISYGETVHRPYNFVSYGG